MTWRGRARTGGNDIESATAALMEQLVLNRSRGTAADGAGSSDAPPPPPSVALDATLLDDLQGEVLAWLPTAALPVAACVCATWRRLLAQDDALWQKHALRQSVSPPPEASGDADGAVRRVWRKQMIEDDLALRNRWRRGAAAEKRLTAKHTDHVSALALAGTTLLSASADYTVRASTTVAPVRVCCDEYVVHHAAPVFDVTCTAAGTHAASCSEDGEARVWRVADGAETLSLFGAAGALKRRPCYRVALATLPDAPRRPRSLLYCGGGGDDATAVRIYDWRRRADCHASELASSLLVGKLDDFSGEAPRGVCTCIERDGRGAVAVGNSAAHSQIRVWDEATGALRDRFSLPGRCGGVRCLRLHGPALLCGCDNGWLVQIDLRTGTFERKLAHAECINGMVLDVDTHRLVSASDDGTVRVTDARTFTALHSQRVRRIVFDVAADRERLYAACDDGSVRVYDHGRAAASTAAASGSTTFDAQQRHALSLALQTARSRSRN